MFRGKTVVSSPSVHCVWHAVMADFLLQQGDGKNLLVLIGTLC